MNGREIATLIWLAVFVAGPLSMRDVRRAARDVASALRPLTVPLLALAAWIAGLLVLGYRERLWIPVLAFDTALWSITALSLFGGAVSVFKKGESVKRLIAPVLGFAVLLEFYVNLYAASVWVELAVIPWVVIWSAMAAYAARSDEHRAVKKLADGVLFVTGVAAVVYVSVHAGTGWHEIKWGEVWRKLVLPIWLTLGMLPFIVVIGMWSAYSTVFPGIRWATEDARRRRLARLALLTRLHVRAREVSAFNWQWCKRLVAAASSLSAARTVVTQFRNGEDGLDSP